MSRFDVWTARFVIRSAQFVPFDVNVIGLVGPNVRPAFHARLGLTLLLVRLWVHLVTSSHIENFHFPRGIGQVWLRDYGAGIWSVIVCVAPLPVTRSRYVAAVGGRAHWKCTRVFW